jgi:hypothetical protein
MLLDSAILGGAATGCRLGLMKLNPIGRTLKFPDMIKTDT